MGERKNSKGQVWLFKKNFSWKLQKLLLTFQPELNLLTTLGYSSVQFSRSVMPNSLGPHGLQHVRLPCPSLSPGVCSNSCSLSRWCDPTISSSVAPFLSFPQSFPASEQMLSRFPSCNDARLVLPAMIVSEHFFVESQDIYHHLVLRTLSQIIWIIL